MNEELNKELCGLLKIQWHEQIRRDGLCLCGEIHWLFNASVLNPNFTSDSGKIALLREMYTKLEKRVFDKFMVRMANPENFMLFLFDDTDKLAIAARDFRPE